MAETSRIVSFIESLETPCTECEGRGFRKDAYSPTGYKCIFYDGTGYVLSDAGERVLEFFDHMVRRPQSRALRP
jgi:hypothetical protein